MTLTDRGSPTWQRRHRLRNCHRPIPECNSPPNARFWRGCAPDFPSWGSASSSRDSGLFLHEIAAARHEPIQSHGGSLWIGVGLVALGVVVLVFSAARFRTYSADLSEGRLAAPPSAAFGIAVTLLLAAGGVAMVWYLLSIGI